MNKDSTNIQQYLNDFEKLDDNVKADWFSEQRQSALKLFQETGFPRTRQENWKYTDTRPIAKKTFSSL